MKMYEKFAPHPIAEEMPDMSEEEFGELREDIRINGLKEKIVVYEGMILDGRHRARALFELGIPLDENTVDEYDESIDGDPAKFVFSMNVARRHLTVGQHAGIALSLARLIAKETPKAKRGRPPEVDSGNPSPIGDQLSKTKKEIRQEAAKITGSSIKTIEKLEAIENKDPDIAREVKQGKKTLNAAYSEVASRKEPIRGKKPSAMTRRKKFVREFALILERPEDRIFVLNSFGKKCVVAMATSEGAMASLSALGWQTSER